MTPAEKKAFDRVSKARAVLVLNHPFFAALALKLKLVPWNEGTMAVDGRHLFFDPEFVADKTDSQLRTVVAHEAMHCALGHIFRRGARDPYRWNQACDHVNNLILKNACFEPVDGWLCDPGYIGMSSEQVYGKLPKPQDQSGQAGNNYGGCGEFLDAADDNGKPANEAEKAQQEREWQVATYQAAQAAKAQGNLPGSVRDLIETMRTSKVDWRAKLREFMRATAANDYNWRRPNHRHIGNGDYFPSLYSETTGPLIIGVDTSGSMSHGELEQIAAEINSVLDTVKPERVDVVYCDTRVANAEVFRPEDYPVKLDVRGGGGTTMAPIWPYVAEQGLDPVAAILCSDLQLACADLGDEPGYPVLVLSTDRKSPYDSEELPFGELVLINE